MKECKKCGTTYDDAVKFCGECGGELVDVVAEVKNEQDRLGDELVKPEEEATQPAEAEAGVTADAVGDESQQEPVLEPVKEPTPELGKESEKGQKSEPKLESKQHIVTKNDTPTEKESKSNDWIWKVLTFFLAVALVALWVYHEKDYSRLSDSLHENGLWIYKLNERIEKLEKQPADVAAAAVEEAKPEAKADAAAVAAPSISE